MKVKYCIGPAESSHRWLIHSDPGYTWWGDNPLRSTFWYQPMVYLRYELEKGK